MMMESADESTNVVLVSFVPASPPKDRPSMVTVAYARTNFYGTTFRCRQSQRNAVGWSE